MVYTVATQHDSVAPFVRHRPTNCYTAEQ